MGSFNCIFENNSLKALFGQNMKKVKILKLSPDSRYLQKLALKKRKKAKKAILEKAANIAKIAKIPYIFEAYLINSLSFSEVNLSHLTPQVRLLFVESKET